MPTVRGSLSLVFLLLKRGEGAGGREGLPALGTHGGPLLLTTSSALLPGYASESTTPLRVLFPLESRNGARGGIYLPPA